MGGEGVHSLLGAYMWKIFGPGPNCPNGLFLYLPSRTSPGGSQRHFLIGNSFSKGLLGLLFHREPLLKMTSQTPFLKLNMHR